ncbi:copper chaperone PCu(A)C [Jatrophihabitans sp. DSM 45814]
MIRPPLSLIAAALAVLLGMAGLVRGSIPQTTASPAAPAPASSIVVGGAYVREPATDLNAAVYFTVYNTGDTPDVLTSVVTGAGAAASLHSETASGGMTITPAGLTIPAKSSVSLSPGKGHVMIEKLYGPLKPGQTVNLQLTFLHAGQILVTAPVIGLLAPAPTAAGPK